MSLTSLLKGELGQWFRVRLPYTRKVVMVANRRIRHHPTAGGEPDNRSLSGTAIDYRLRYYFGIESLGGRAAHKGADRSAVPTKLRDAFFSALQDTLDELSPVGVRLDDVAEQRLVRFCVVLGLLEQRFRALVVTPIMDGVRDGTLVTVADLLAVPSEATVHDVSQMSRAFFEQQYVSLDREPIVLNPTFPGSSDVGGADGDMITGRLLVDFKSTAIDRPLKGRDLYQLIGYTCLDYDEEQQIESVGVSFVRRGALVEWPIEDLLRKLSRGKYGVRRLRRDFLGWRRQRLERELADVERELDRL